MILPFQVACGEGRDYLGPYSPSGHSWRICELAKAGASASSKVLNLFVGFRSILRYAGCHLEVCFKFNAG